MYTYFKCRYAVGVLFRWAAAPPKRHERQQPSPPHPQRLYISSLPCSSIAIGCQLAIEDFTHCFHQLLRSFQQIPLQHFFLCFRLSLLLSTSSVATRWESFSNGLPHHQNATRDFYPRLPTPPQRLYISSLPCSSIAIGCQLAIEEPIPTFRNHDGARNINYSEKLRVLTHMCECIWIRCISRSSVRVCSQRSVFFLCSPLGGFMLLCCVLDSLVPCKLFLSYPHPTSFPFRS